ncbi:MAG: site-2 protease family protein [Gaiellales bacterium]|nr:site-2 protease family protein [Gaiellales bacterium]
MSTVIGIVVGIVGLGFLILVHELGHFLVAKATGMRVEEFSLGYGRFLVSRRIGETIYGISALPLGGYVRVTGMHQEEFEARVEAARTNAELTLRDPESRLTGASAISDEEVARTPLQHRYYAHPLWQRLVFVAAGVLMNLVVAYLLLFAAGMQGYYVPTTSIEEVVAGSPAAVAGILAGDRLVSVGDAQVESWEDAVAAIEVSPGRPVTVVVERGGTQLELVATPAEQDGKGFLGVGPVAEKKPSSLGQGVEYATSRFWGMFAAVFVAIGDLVTGEAAVTGEEGLSGPIGIVAISSEAYQGGYFLVLLAFISIQLGILNMLPLLPLDGGHFLINVLQALSRRVFSLRTFERISLVGLGLFLILALVATGNDLGRLFGAGGF